MWRAEDDALLARLEDEQLLARMWRWHLGEGGASAASRGRAPHARAAGIFPLLRALPGGEDALRAAHERDDFRPIDTLLVQSSAKALPPPLLHHTALYFGAVADGLEHASGQEADDAIVRTRVRSLAAWLALGEERRYLHELGTEIAAGALREVDLARAIAEAPLEPIDALGARAKEGARDLTSIARLSLACLARVGDASRDPRAVRRAASRRAAAIDAALAPISDALAQASASEGTPKSAAILRRIVHVWEWSERDESVERFAVDRTIPVAWELYRAASWNALREALAPLDPLVEKLAARIAADPSNIAYAASCAEMFVFRAQLESPLARQIETAERALTVCPSHRNGRLILASYLCEQATTLLASHLGLVRKRDLAVTEAYLDRAEKLFPSCERLPDARARVADAKRFAVR